MEEEMQQDQEEEISSDSSSESEEEHQTVMDDGKLDRLEAKVLLFGCWVTCDS
jgi:hypothetical protein